MHELNRSFVWHCYFVLLTHKTCALHCWTTRNYLPRNDGVVESGKRLEKNEIIRKCTIPAPFINGLLLWFFCRHGHCVRSGLIGRFWTRWNCVLFIENKWITCFGIGQRGGGLKSQRTSNGHWTNGKRFRENYKRSYWSHFITNNNDDYDSVRCLTGIASERISATPKEGERWK